jgi:hypothetical protein
MSSKRNLRRKQCERKIRHASAGAARHFGQQIVRRGGDELNVYHCEFCGGWHLGHTPARIEAARATNARDYRIRQRLR